MSILQPELNWNLALGGKITVCGPFGVLSYGESPGPCPVSVVFADSSRDKFADYPRRGQLRHVSTGTECYELESWSNLGFLAANWENALRVFPSSRPMLPDRLLIEATRWPWTIRLRMMERWTPRTYDYWLAYRLRGGALSFLEFATHENPNNPAAPLAVPTEIVPEIKRDYDVPRRFGD